MAHVVLNQPDFQDELAKSMALGKALEEQIRGKKERAQAAEAAARQYVLSTGVPLGKDDLARMAPSVDWATFQQWQASKEVQAALKKLPQEAEQRGVQTEATRAQTNLAEVQAEHIAGEADRWAKQYGLSERSQAFIEEQGKRNYDLAVRQLEEGLTLSRDQMAQTAKLALFQAKLQAYFTDQTVRAQLDAAVAGGQTTFIKEMGTALKDLSDTVAKRGFESYQELADKDPVTAYGLRGIIHLIGKQNGVSPEQIDQTMFGPEAPAGEGWFAKTWKGFSSTIVERGKQLYTGIHLDKAVQNVTDLTNMLFPAAGTSPVATPSTTPTSAPPAPTPAPAPTASPVPPVLAPGFSATQRTPVLLDPSYVDMLFKNSVGR